MKITRLSCLVAWAFPLLVSAATEHALRIAVWDTGVAVQEEYFAPHRVTNAGELVDGRAVPNGIDDDRNGFIDDLHGLVLDDDRSREVSDPTFPHGSQVASVAVAGLPWLGLVPIRQGSILRPGQEPGKTLFRPVTTADRAAASDKALLVAAFLRAWRVRLVNISFGSAWEDKLRESLDPSEDGRRLAAEHYALERQYYAGIIDASPGVLFVVAAGNDRKDLAAFPCLPQVLERPNLLVVGGLAYVPSLRQGIVLSNFGPSVNLWAPYLGIPCWDPVSRKPVTRVGTSFSAPLVARMAAQLWHALPGLRAEEVARALLDSRPFSRSEKEADLEKALELARRDAGS